MESTYSKAYKVVRYRNLTDEDKRAICKRNKKEVLNCATICPLRIRVKNSFICLKDLDKIVKFDLGVKILMEDKKDDRLGIEVQTESVEGAGGTGCK